MKGPIKVFRKKRDPSISGMSITKMMQFMPLLEETKMEMYTELMACTMPIFKDTSQSLQAIQGNEPGTREK